MSPRVLSFGELLALVAPFVIWSLAFVALYGLHGGVCAAAPPGDGGLWLRAGLIGTWVVMGAVAVLWTVWAWRRRDSGSPAVRFIRALSAGVAVSGAVSTVWVGLPILLLPVCV